MYKPFPFALNVGTDICNIPRIRNILKSHRGRRFVDKILTEDERASSDLVKKYVSKFEMYQKALKINRDLELRKPFQLGRKKGKRTHMELFPERNPTMLEQDTVQQVGDGNMKDKVAVDKPEAVVDGDNTVVPSVNGATGKIDDSQILALLQDRNDQELKDIEKELRGISQFMAGRFAAKEAVIKAHQDRRLTYGEISILPRPNKGPIAIVHAAKMKGEEAVGSEARISISHDGSYATAICLACEVTEKSPHSNIFSSI